MRGRGKATRWTSLHACMCMCVCEGRVQGAARRPAPRPPSSLPSTTQAHLHIFKNKHGSNQASKQADICLQAESASSFSSFWWSSRRDGSTYQAAGRPAIMRAEEVGRDFWSWELQYLHTLQASV